MEYKYYKEVTGELVRVHIEQDTTPENPRYDWDGNIGHMMCWHRNYQLGDYKENSYSDNLDFLNNLLRAISILRQMVQEYMVKRRRQSNRKIDRGGKTCYSVLQQVLD